MKKNEPGPPKPAVKKKGRHYDSEEIGHYDQQGPWTDVGSYKPPKPRKRYEENKGYQW